MGRTEEDRTEESKTVEEKDDLERDELPPEEEVSLDDYINDYIEDDEATYKLRGDSYNPEDENKTLPIAVENTFHEYMEQQLGMLDFKDEREKTIALQIAGSIDDDGYLRRETEAILDDLVFSQNVSATKEEVELWLLKIQHFDPPGSGARTLQECLVLQIENKLSR